MHMADMLHTSATFASSKDAKKALAANDEIFRYCSFESATIEGGDSDGVFLSCTFRDVEWYWGLFNMALFVSCKFERCTFRGTSFAGCRLVECSFSNCKFLSDNVGGSCTATETSVYGCSLENSEGFDHVFQTVSPNYNAERPL